MKKVFAQLIACGSILTVCGATSGIILGTWDKPENIIAEIEQEENFVIDGGYRFEFEEAEITGKSQNSSDTPLADHMCIGHSLEYSSKFSNGFCMKNISSYTEDVLFTFNFTSGTAGKATVSLSVASKYDKKTSSWSEINLSTSYEITNNGVEVGIDEVKIPKATASDVTGPSNFFAMVNVTFDIDLVQGNNSIVFKAKKVAQNIDYFDLLTDSVISYTPARSLGNGDQLVSIVEAPTMDKTGTLSLSCTHPGCQNGKDGTLPVLSDPFYKAGKGENEGKYLVTLFGKTFAF